MTPFKNRKIDRSKPVRVYRNLNRTGGEGEVWYSLSQKINGSWLVVAHSQMIVLKDVVPKISKAGSDRVKKEQERNVHAFLQGFLVKSVQLTVEDIMVPIYYNPFTCNCFLWGNGQSKEEFKGSPTVVLNNWGVLALKK